MSLSAPSRSRERHAGNSPSPLGYASPSTSSHRHLHPPTAPPSNASASDARGNGNGSDLEDARRRSSSRFAPQDRPVINSRPITLWTHEPPNFSSQEIVLNPDVLAKFGHLGEEDLLEVTLPPGVTGRGPNNTHNSRSKKRFRKSLAARSFVFRPSQGLPEGDNSSSTASTSTTAAAAGATRSSGQLQLSLSRNIASMYGFYNRAEVVLSKVPKAQHAISHVELYFRDQYVGRADMWRLTAQMEDTCVYVGQKITLAGSVRAHIGRIFIKERKVTSGYVAPDTKAIFRSESAKHHLFLQMGREMWDFDEDGEIYYEKAINGFIPELLKRWRSIPTNHVISVILFARVWYDESELSMLQDAALPVRKEDGPPGRHYVDYYNVIVDLESNCDWTEVTAMLKEEFFRFQHDILLIGRPIAGPVGAPWQEEQHADLVRRDRALLAGRISASHEGNLLEAVNLALNPFDEHYIDRDLNRTGLDLIIVTAGTGHFRVDKRWLRLTTERMIDNGIGLDMVCLTKMPLHSVPLFHFSSHLPQHAPPDKRRTTTAGGPGSTTRLSSSANPPDPLYDDYDFMPGLGNTETRFGSGSTAGRPAPVSPPTMQFYSIPHWIDASFYNLQQDQPFRADRFVPRVKMQEIQQIGYMENEISDISLPYLDLMRLADPASVIKPTGSKSLGGAGQGQHSASGGHTGSAAGQSATSSRLDVAPSRNQRRLLRERFDVETFRDLEKAPPPVKSNSVYALGGRRAGLLSGQTPIATSRREGSFDTLSERGVPVAGSATTPTGPPDRNVVTPRIARIGRDSLRGRPALESHAEDETSESFFGEHKGDSSVGEAWDRNRDTSLSAVYHDGKQVDSPQLTPSLSATTSLSSINRYSQGYFSNVSTTSRPSSIRSVSTFSKSGMLRPLQPIGKADAFVAPSQPEDLVGDLPGDTSDSSQSSRSPAQVAAHALLGQSGSSSTAPSSPRASPLSRRTSADYLRSASASRPRKNKLNPAGWLWNSFTTIPSDSHESSSASSSSRLATSNGKDDASPKGSDGTSTPTGQGSSAASLRIKALLKGVPVGSAPPKNGSRSAAQGKPKSQIPISIPTLQQDQDGKAGQDGPSKTVSRPTNDKDSREGTNKSSSDSQARSSGQLSRNSAGTNDTTVDVRILQEQEAYEQALEEEEAKARYAQNAQVEKQTLVNPSNPRKSLTAKTTANQMLRWQHLFPRRLNRHVVKWRSITTPACLPLTTFYLPTEQELQDQWAEYPHTLSVSSEFSSFLVKRTTSTAPALSIMRELTSQRLAQGFQFIVPMNSSGGDGRKEGRDAGVVSSRRYAYRSQRSNFVLHHPSQLFQPGTLTSGNPILLGMSNQVHRISYDRAAGAINVERYIRKMPYDTSPIEYSCCVWPRSTSGYRTVKTTFKYPEFGAYDWTNLDSLVAGHADEDRFTDGLRYWRTRFVIVPSEGRPPPMLAPTGEPLDDEEIRLIGMDRLADAFARARWKGRSASSNQRTPGASLLRFIPTSLDPSMSMWDKEFMRRMEAAIVEDEQVQEADEAQRRASRKKNIRDSSLDVIAVAMSSDKYGLRVEDRVWNRLFYPASFSGTDLTSWLVSEFTDIKTRDEAIEWGSKLMKQGMFEHVHAVHGFLDGHYFYRFKPEWAKKVLAGRNQRKEDDVRRLRDSSDASAGSQTLTDSTNMTSPPRRGNGSTRNAHGRQTGARRMKMSRSLIIDVDPLGRSDRAETAFLHYDISHNPSNGFNAQLHWLGTTARFIDDAVQNWTRLVERHGLRLIEAPIGQICDVHQHNPFQAPSRIPLALSPPAASSYAHLLPSHVNPEEYFEWCLLRKFGFVLDQEASHRYPDDVEIIYESRPARFEHSQFVHKSGVAFVQVLGREKGFLWLNNRLFNSHVNKRKVNSGGSGNTVGGTEGAHSRGRHGGSMGKPSASSGIGAGFGGGGRINSRGNPTTAETNDTTPDPDRTRKEFAAFCADATALHAFYLEVLKDMPKLLQPLREGTKGHQ
ncbi:unnamed protein product [Sympodiomycopsis kandeliae]